MAQGTEGSSLIRGQESVDVIQSLTTEENTYTSGIFPMDDAFRAYLEGVRRSLLQQVAHIEKLLGMSSREHRLEQRIKTLEDKLREQNRRR